MPTFVSLLGLWTKLKIQFIQTVALLHKGIFGFHISARPKTPKWFFKAFEISFSLTLYSSLNLTFTMYYTGLKIQDFNAIGKISSAMFQNNQKIIDVSKLSRKWIIGTIFWIGSELGNLFKKLKRFGHIEYTYLIIHSNNTKKLIHSPFVELHFMLKAHFSMKPAKKSLDSLAGK